MPNLHPLFRHSQAFALLFGCALCAVSFPIHADTQNPPGEFENIIDDANRAAKNNNGPQAIDHWKKAYAIRPEHFVACAISQVALRIERKKESAKWFTICRRTAKLSKTEKGIERRSKELQEFEIIKAQLVELEIEADDGASIFVNGEPEGAAPIRFPVYVDPGSIAIEARKDQQIIKREIDGVQGQTIRISLSSPPFLAPAPLTESRLTQSAKEPTETKAQPLAPRPISAPLSLSPEPTPLWPRARPWVVGGNLALAGVAAGLGIWLRNEMTKAQSNETTYLANGVLALGADDVDRAKTEVQKAVDENHRTVLFHQLSIACFVASGVFGASGMTAFFIKGTKSQPTSIGLTGRFTW